MVTISGTSGDDILSGGDGDDTLNGHLGVDILHGGDGDDVLDSGSNDFAGTRLGFSYEGDAGGNQLYGDNGDDVLSGGAGDRLDGGAGNDIFTIRHGTLSLGRGAINVTGGDGDDTIKAGAELYGVIDAGAGADTIELFIRYNTGPATRLSVITGAGADTISIPNGGVSLGLSTVPATVDVTDFTVTGPEHDSIILTGGGNIFAAGGANPYALAQVGDDTAVFRLQFNADFQGSTPYLLLKGVNAQTLTAANFGGFDPGPIWTIGGTGDDRLTASAGGNHLQGFEGADVLIGGAGDDVLVGGSGADTLAGATGADTFAYYGLSTVAFSHNDSTLAARDQITDFESGIDSLDFTRAQPVSVQVVTNGDQSLVYAYDSGGVASAIHIAGSILTTDVIAAAGTVKAGVQGTSLPDTLVGTSGDDVILGGEALDVLTGGGGKDIFAYLRVTESTPGSTDQITDFQTGADVIDLSSLAVSHVTITQNGDGSGLVEATTDEGDMRIEVQGAVLETDVWANGDATGFTLITADGDQSLIGTAAYDRLVGETGDDVIIGAAGSDNLTGGAGADTFLYRHTSDSLSSDYDIIADFEQGVDVIDLSAIGAFSISLIHSGSATYLFVPDASETRLSPMTIAVAGNVQATDIRTGLNTSFYIVGDTMGQTLVGGVGFNTIVGGGGADALFSGTGTTYFTYTAASDSNAAAYDIIHGFKAGTDKLDLGGLNASNVSIVNHDGGTFVFGRSGAESFQIASTQTINGSDLLGLSGGIYIVGGDAGGVLIGSSNGDTVIGGASVDVIRGGGSGDALFGGAGADVFVYGGVDDSRPSSLDILHDFQTGVDALDLSALAPSNVSIIRYNGGSFISGISGSQTFQIASTQDLNASDIIGLTSGAYIVGDDGVNVLTGGTLAESIVGGSGDDVIIGGGGADALYGGAGADAFKYLAASQSTLSAADIVHDFQAGVDKVDLTAIHASTSDAFGFAYADGATFLFVDQGGNGVNEMLIEFTGATLSAADIVW
ncbi:calcium-binding protein [Caulobacter sp. BK020]|uniref:calcium-binding protein n=1 Tax=Caulobacter sp. BK020 TaxID=2512117 RepID=UPI00104CE914|nr:calcium-binding protein [Caulobacter sp. BK020]TCS18439.1 hemolysin type calcium-binding protein [Caulobacter sp. BK020]